MTEKPLRPMRPMSASDVRAARRPSGMTLLIRFVVLVAAIAVLMLAKYVWHAPEWTVFVIAGAEILVLVGVTTFTAIAARRRLTRQAPPS